MLGAFWTEMPGYLPFTWESRKFWLENEIVDFFIFFFKIKWFIFSVWEASENMGYDLRGCHLFYSC